MGPKGDRGDSVGLPVGYICKIIHKILFENLKMKHVINLIFLRLLFQGPPGPPGLPGRPGMFNCPKGVSTHTHSLTQGLWLVSPHSSGVFYLFTCSLSSLLLRFLKTVFPIPPRPHCKMAVSFRPCKHIFDKACLPKCTYPFLTANCRLHLHLYSKSHLPFTHGGLKVSKRDTDMLPCKFNFFSSCCIIVQIKLL